MHVSAFLYYLAVCLLMLVTQVIHNWQYAILALSLKAGRAACSIVHMYPDDLTAPNSWTFNYTVFSYYKQCFSEHPCAYIIVHKCKYIRRIDSQEVELLGQRFVCAFFDRSCQIALIEIVPILLSPAMCESTYFPTPTLPNK